MKFQVKPETEQFLKDPTVTQWISSLHPNTASAYKYTLFHLCKSLGVSPSEILQQAESNSKELGIKVKILLRNNPSKLEARKMKSVLGNFLALHELELPLTGLKLKHRRSPSHPLMQWEEAERVIELSDAEYRPAYKVMLYSAFDAERFIQVNNDPAILADVKRQVEAGNDLVKITIKDGRKNNPDPYYVLFPREIAMLLPVRAHGKPLDNKVNLWYNWRKAVRNAGYTVGGHKSEYGAHNLRSVWQTEMTKRNLPGELREHQLGHVVDSLHYQRITSDEKYVLEQHRKAWKLTETASKQDLEALQTEMSQMREWMESIFVKEQIDTKPWKRIKPGVK